MCGILGLTVGEGPFRTSKLSHLINDLFLFSESRGKEASGVAVCSGENIQVLKSAVAASSMIRTKQYRKLMRQTVGSGLQEPVTIIGHSRLVTDGSRYHQGNNQPVLASECVGIHNGIIVNNEEIWMEQSDLQRQYQVDSEVILALLRKFLRQHGSIIEAAQLLFDTIQGSASIAVLLRDYDRLLLATNTGSLYYASIAPLRTVIFASEKYILDQLLLKHLPKHAKHTGVKKIAPQTGCLIDLQHISVLDFSLLASDQSPASVDPKRKAARTIVELEGILPKNHSDKLAQQIVGRRTPLDIETINRIQVIGRKYPHDSTWQDTLRRCTRCVLPETMPFISFDHQGVCNYCRFYRKIPYKGEAALHELMKPFRRADGGPECVIGISGGRDSLYTLHYTKRVLGMNAVAYTYDWGMVTDLARRNISRICAQLGVEHILVSADIGRKRENIRKNVVAWLKRPSLGTIPLFMAGDKQFYYYLKKVREQLGVGVSILGENMLERTDFKTGFANVAPYWDPNHVYTLSATGKFKLLMFYAWQYLTNPAYINASLFDTAWASVSYYGIKRDFCNLYTFIPWIEQEVNSTLLDRYNFELAQDTRSTWRIGDGTAAFYNYIYYNIAGFTENETFRSNQIREGLLAREQALQLIRTENQPRFESIKWYCDTIGISFEDTIERIRAIPHLRPRQGRNDLQLSHSPSHIQ
jgi:glutamine---fructose-6-phosphate transaminase (isomerizing)